MRRIFSYPVVCVLWFISSPFVVEPHDSSLLYTVYSWVPLWMVAAWVDKDRLRRGWSSAYDLDTAAFMALPVVFPYYLISSRGRKSWKAFAIIAALGVAWVALSIAVDW